MIFSPTLNRPKKIEWFIYQLSLSIVMCVRPWATLHTRARAEPDGARLGFGWRAAPFKGFLNLLHFGSPFLFWPSGLTSKLLVKWLPSTGLGMILEYLETRSDSRVLGLGVISEQTSSTCTRSHPRVLGVTRALSNSLWSTSQLLCWFVTFSWLDKSGYVNMQSCCKLIATNVNARLICMEAICNR